MTASIDAHTLKSGLRGGARRARPRPRWHRPAARQAAGLPLVVLDGRPVSEFHKMNIPGAICCPNGELALRVSRLVPDAATPIVVK